MEPEARLPTHVTVSALIRNVEAEGGFAYVVSKGERDAGVLLIVTQARGEPAKLWERMPQADGQRCFTMTREQRAEHSQEFTEYLRKRAIQDPDCWVVELEISNPERFIDTITG
jgi:hypothetical protein